MEIPVFLFTGFLDSGKSTYIRRKIETHEIPLEGKTLLLLCENGEEEFTDDWCKKYQIDTVFVKRPELLTCSFLVEALSRDAYQRMIVEYNGMWDLKFLYHAFPYPATALKIFVQEKYCCMDANTVLLYEKNMKQLLGDKLRSSDKIIINRMSDSSNVEQIYKSARMFSGRAKIIYEYEDGRIQCDERPYTPPYRLDVTPIEVFDEAFALFCHDMLRYSERYDGKEIRLRGMVVHDPELGENAVLFGRNTLKYSVHDGFFNGLICNCPYENRPSEESWILLTAKVRYIHQDYYGDVGPVLDLISYEPTIPARQNMTAFL